VESLVLFELEANEFTSVNVDLDTLVTFSKSPPLLWSYSIVSMHGHSAMAWSCPVCETDVNEISVLLHKVVG
jgi:hypothetical protein